MPVERMLLRRRAVTRKLMNSRRTLRTRKFARATTKRTLQPLPSKTLNPRSNSRANTSSLVAHRLGSPRWRSGCISVRSTASFAPASTSPFASFLYAKRPQTRVEECRTNQTRLTATCPRYLHSWPGHLLHTNLNKLYNNRHLSTRTDDDFYSILNVSKSASKDEIKKAYFKLAKQYHPDLNPGDEHAKRRFQQVSEAYSVLKDERKRREYDSLGRKAYNNAHSQRYYGSPQDTSAYYETFREVFDEFGLQDLDIYAKTVRDEANFALSQAQSGNYTPAWEFAKKRKGLIFSIVLPFFLILRFPGLIIAAMRGLMLAAVMALRNPIVRRLILQFMYKRFLQQGARRGPRG